MRKILPVFSRTPVQVKLPKLRTNDGMSEKRIQKFDKSIPAYCGRRALQLIFFIFFPDKKIFQITLFSPNYF